MDNIKRCFILIFTLSLSYAPLAICWYLPLNTEFNPLAIFYYIFQDSPAKNVMSRGKMISFDSESIMKNEMLFMKVMGVICVVTIMIFLTEFLVQAIKKKNLDNRIKFTSVLLLAVMVIQFVNSFSYRQMYEVVFSQGDETEWKCMWELNLAELLIVIGICINLYKKKRKKTENSRQMLFGHAIYSILLLIIIQSSCFYCARYGIIAEKGDYLYDYTIFLEDVLFYGNIQQIDKKEGLISILPLLFVLILFIIVMMMKKKIRETVVYVLDMVLKILTVLLFCQISYVCVFLNQTWLFIPDIPVIIFLGWGSYRFLKGLPEKKVMA